LGKIGEATAQGLRFNGAMTTASAASVEPDSDIGSLLERYRRELTGYCYRMVGSAHDAEDAVQETMVRAWRGYDRFEGRSALRSWLYRIATNVCYDQLNGRRRRAQPMAIDGATPIAEARLGAPMPESTFVQPIADDRILPPTADPAELTVARDSIRLAFIAALQHLPPRQRAVLILRDVLRWKASEVADLLGTTVVSVNSVLQRAHATLAASGVSDEEVSDESSDAEHRQLAERYLAAFERYDIDALVELLHEDASLTMPPFALWLKGSGDIAGWYRLQRDHCRNSRLVALSANGSPAFAQYVPARSDGGYEPFALQVLEMSAGRIREIHTFLDTAALFPLFGLPEQLAGSVEVGQ
jgi:RNA polymerase sigma-70 factor (ECF subfamily)